MKSAGFQSTSKPTSKLRRNRNAFHRVHSVPEGFMLCRRCTGLIDLSKVCDGIARCPQGHSYDLDQEEREQREREERTRGSRVVPPYSGLTPDKFGKFVEEIVFEHRDFGDLGVIVSCRDGIHGALDFITVGPLGRGAMEVKGCDIDAPTKAFNLAMRKYRERKDQAMRDQGCDFAIMVLVVVDFRSLTASIYVRTDTRFKYWELAQKDEPFAVVAFTLPPKVEAVVGGADRASELLAVGAPEDDMPF